MTKNVFIVAAVATILATSASAQNLIGRDTVAGDLNEDLIEAIEDDAERELDRFGNEGRPQGFTGSVALRGIAQSGNTESVNIGIGTDMNYVFGPNGIELQLNYAYSDDDDTASEESLFYGLEYTRDLTPEFFGFAKLQGSADNATDAQYETDTFASFGAGYRVFNEADRQWSLQAGPGYRFAELNDITDGDVSEAAFGVSSDYAQKLTENVFFTNDTDVIWSESDTVVFNDLAMNVSMTETLALRTSILTEFHTEPGTAEDTDNTFGVSLVYSFN
ncbi:hypothetical protein AN191_02010 [Loktanella sp. 5RATIMAR09]|uniref:DUF481 domain-containing protein n=1 Tax=Loktanella sp. 5RATIMAR09 TaxID=1225655 RepID=UPI0006EBE139|nr:DUF481 domain-containing protein [Loktanella sp. 5RATIMAR09]KQI73672.1 hypothetical protein AN191_02010 [Loktanella sp. 5RATIMAR09]